METEQRASDAEAIIEAVERLDGAEFHGFTRGTSQQAGVLVVPTGKQVFPIKKFLDEYLDAPERRRGTARLTTLVSFIDHVNRFKDGHSAVFADVTGSTPRLMGVLDYHGPAERRTALKTTDSGTVFLEGPRFCEHRAVYEFPLSKEWVAWTAAAGKKTGMSQVDFAEFLEDRLVDVLDPDARAVDDTGRPGEPLVGATARKMAQLLGIALATPQRLLELSRGLSVSVGQVVTAHNNISTGEGRISFSEEHKTDKGQPLQVPGGFVIGIPVFREGVLYQLPVRLRYRVASQAVTWFISLQRADVAFDDAVKATAETAQKSTQLPLFFGTPEV